MKLISDSVKRTLQTELQSVFEDTTVSVVADFTTHYMGEKKMSSKDLVFILTCGNASRSTDEIKLITCPITLTCICPIAYKNKNDVAQKLHDWFERYAIDKNILEFKGNTATEYYGYFDVLTPFVAGNVRNFASQKCTDITISGNVILCETAFSFDVIPEIKIDNVVLNNVISLNRKNIIVTSNYNVLGSQRQTKIKDYVTTTYTIQFIMDKTIPLHYLLAIDTSNTSHKLEITYNYNGFVRTDTVTTYFDSDITFQKDTFNVATLTIVR